MDPTVPRQKHSLKTDTLQDALETASAHWLSGRGGAAMEGFARASVEFLGGTRECASLGASDATRYLTHLRKKLSAASVVAYYSAFRRMLSLAGYPPPASWPKAPTPPRKSRREPIADDDLKRVIIGLRGRGWSETADLALLLRGCGLRVRVEALAMEALKITPGDTYDTLEVVGKGEHERPVPVVDPAARAILQDASRMQAIRRIPYKTHGDRWRKVVSQSDVKSGLASFHALRHAYACHALERSGGNLVLVQELLGHSDPATTARYLKVDLAKKAEVLAGEP